MKTYTFETQTCSRCLGTGNYSYCTMYGSRCFKCGGAKVVLTKRGAAAQRFFETLSSKPAGEIAIGEVIQQSGITMRGDPFYYWAKVVRIEQPTQVTSWVNGVAIDPATQIELVTSHEKFGETRAHMAKSSLVRVSDPESLPARRAAALEYQSTLTKMGKVKKRIGATTK